MVKSRVLLDYHNEILGCAMGIEDAGMLAILLPLGTRKNDLPSRLAAHQELRKKRAETIADFSKQQQYLETTTGLVGRRGCNIKTLKASS